MFKKLVAIENTLLHEDALKKLSDYAACVELHDERAADEDELIRRIGDADAVLVSFKTTISKTMLDACPNIRYIGMCCTLYEQACNVDLTEARKLGITVTGVRDYGDEGVVEYAISELVRFLHGFGECQWKPVRQELTRQKVGVIGLGRTGRMLADAFRFLGADVAYYSRTRKTDAEEAGIAYHPLHDLLRHSDIVFTCLPRNTRLLGALEDNHLQIRESRVREEILGAQIKVTNYAHQLRLTPFVRVSHYLRTTLGSSTNMEVGARFTFPFYGDASAKRKAMRTEQALTALGREKLTETVTTECRRLIAQLGQLNTALASEQRHVALLRRFIDIRTEGYVNSQGGYNHIARLEEYNEFLRSLERTYDLLRRRALCLLELQEATGCPDMAALIQTKEMTR